MKNNNIITKPDLKRFGTQHRVVLDKIRNVTVKEGDGHGHEKVKKVGERGVCDIKIYVHTLFVLFQLEEQARNERKNCRKIVSVAAKQLTISP